MATEATKQDIQTKRGFFRRTRLYLLEYSLYHLFLMALLSYVVYTFYALFWAIAGKPFDSGLIEANVWFIAGGIVFTPITYMVYTRTRWEEVANPARLRQVLRVVITYIQLITGIIASVTFALITLISFLRWAVGFADVSSLLTVTVPSLINAAIVSFVTFDIMGKNPRFSLKVFRPVFFSVCAVASLILLILTVVFSRLNGYDLQTMRDLREVSQKVNDKYAQENKIVSDFSQLALDQGVINRVGERQYKIENKGRYGDDDTDYKSTYSYNSGSYKLCATFKNSVKGKSSYSSSVLDIRSRHPAGNHCFDMYASKYSSSRYD